VPVAKEVPQKQCYGYPEVSRILEKGAQCSETRKAADTIWPQRKGQDPNGQTDLHLIPKTAILPEAKAGEQL